LSERSQNDRHHENESRTHDQSVET